VVASVSVGDILVALAPSNGALGREEVAPPLAWTFHRRALNKRQTPDSGEDEVDFSRFLVDFRIFPCGPLGSVPALEDSTGEG